MEGQPRANHATGPLEFAHANGEPIKTDINGLRAHSQGNHGLPLLPGRRIHQGRGQDADTDHRVNIEWRSSVWWQSTFGANEVITQNSSILNRLGMQRCNPAHRPGHALELRKSLTSRLLCGSGTSTCTPGKTRHVDEYYREIGVCEG